MPGAVIPTPGTVAYGRRTAPKVRYGSPTVSRQVGDTCGRAPRTDFTAYIAAHTGTSERRVQHDATRTKRIPKIERIVGTSLDSATELDALAQLPADH